MCVCVCVYRIEGCRGEGGGWFRILGAVISERVSLLVRFRGFGVSELFVDVLARERERDRVVPQSATKTRQNQILKGGRFFFEDGRSNM